jgi:choline dehydrogenase-like flavoprotein
MGRGLMDNVHVIVAGAFDERFDPRGLPIDARVWDFGSKGPAARGVPGGCGLGVSGVDAAYPGPLPYAARLAALWGEEHHRTMREHFGRVVCVFGVAEKLPDPENRLERDPVRRDEDGYPELRVSTRRPPGEARQLEFLREACRGLLDASGAREIVQETFSGDSGGGGTHVVGTCRMGKDPARSVVDPWGRAHDVRNLFVADGSVFVTQGGGDSPSLTIQALALRAADRLADALAKGEL